MATDKAEHLGLGLVGILATLATWELAVRTGLLPQAEIPAATDVIAHLAGDLGDRSFWSAVGQTLAGAGIGLAVATAIGVPLGMVMGSSAAVRNALRPTIEFLRPVPGVALIPLALLVFGQTMSSDVFLVAFGCTFPMLVQTMYGVAGVDEVAVATARSYGLSAVDRLRWVTLPAALPYIATGLRICSAIALIIAVTAELVTGTPGIGSDIRRAQGATNATEMYALILAAGLLGILTQFAFGRFERRFLRWHQSQREAAA